MTPTLSQPLINRLVPVRNNALRVTVQVTVGVLLMALLSQVRLELGPVPLTGQTLGVLLIGAAYGFSLGGLTMLAYLVVGGLGLGVFSGGAAGWAVFTGATAGYLLGFPVAAAVVGFLAQRGFDRRVSTTALAMFIGNLIIYVPGLLWLKQLAPDWPTTLQWGLVPFIPGDLLKLLVAALLLPAAWKLLGKRRA